MPRELQQMALCCPNFPGRFWVLHFSFLTQTLRTTDYATKACLTLGFEEAALWQDGWHIVYTDDSTHCSNLDMNNMKILIDTYYNNCLRFKIYRYFYIIFPTMNFQKFVGENDLIFFLRSLFVFKLWQDWWHIVYTDDLTQGSNLDMNNMKILIVWIHIKILKMFL